MSQMPNICRWGLRLCLFHGLAGVICKIVKFKKIGNIISILYGVDWTVWMDIYSRVICMSIRRLPQLYFRSRIGSLCRNGMLLQSPLL